MSGHYCTACGHPLDPGSRFCTGCGQVAEGDAPAGAGAAVLPQAAAAPLSPPAPAPPVSPAPVPAPSGDRGRRAVALVGAAIVGVLAVITVVVTVLAIGGDGEDEAGTVSAPATATSTTAPTTTATPATTAAPTTTAAPATTAPPSPDRGDEAIDAVEARFCPPEPGMEDWTTYITELRAEEVDVLLYRVAVRVELDSGGWTAAYDVDFATELGPEVRPLDDDSASLLC